MERRKLSAAEIEARLAGLNDWTVANEKLSKKFEFGNFAESLDFVNRVGAIAEARDHHPDILFGWGYAEFFITTHDRGGLTDFDFALALEIEKIKS
ncbi:MAG TPA: 4a-hydroxytetrahydrobiopterin dehydratase [Pyrinomonadaceae bacterium]|nr:4a-hydroxytetrahydrobiopterin dehydratase [Pyrinomonadaceae bacterium]